MLWELGGCAYERPPGSHYSQLRSAVGSGQARGGQRQALSQAAGTVWLHPHQCLEMPFYLYTT